MAARMTSVNRTPALPPACGGPDTGSLRGTRIAVVGGALPHRDTAWPVIERISAALTGLGYRNEVVDAEREDFVGRVAGFGVAYLAHFGIRGDDGTTQGALAALGVQFSGSGSKATALAQDKVLAKTVLRARGVRTPDFLLVDQRTAPQDFAATAFERLGRPLVVKPVLGGGSYGLTLASTPQEMVDGIAAAAQYGPVFLEAFVPGRTLTAGVLGAGADQLVLTAHEVVFQDDRPFLDPVTLFQPGSSETVYPPRVAKATAHEVEILSLRAHRTLGAHGVSRSDFKVDAAGRPWFLELNTMPAMSSVSDLPVAAARAGLTFSALVERILGTALDREWWSR
jgi:D-alanine-D-alanine ligase